MKCQILFSGKNKKNISKCRLLKILPRVLSVKLPVSKERALAVHVTYFIKALVLRQAGLKQTV